jgi:AraC-like DNA-binding protein
MIAGAGHTLVDAFANLEHASSVERVSRHPCRNLLGARIALALEEGQGYWDFTQIGNDVYVVIGNFAYKDPRLEFIPGDGLVQFYFTLSGDLTLAVSRTEPLRLNRPSLLVYSQPKGMDMSEWTAPSAQERIVAISLRPQFLIDNFCGSSVEAPPQFQSFVSGTPGQFEYYQLPLNSQMFELATKLVTNPYAGILALVYTEAVALELLCAAIGSFQSLASLPTQQFSQRELRCLHLARGVLMKQLAPAPTIHDVARAAGMSETTLKRGFKAVFGETIFDFSVRCRMQHALTLLREERAPVARVAAAVGYSHQTSFATAFRRHFGIRPKDVRGNSLA